MMSEVLSSSKRQLTQSRLCNVSHSFVMLSEYLCMHNATMALFSNTV